MTLTPRHRPKAVDNEPLQGGVVLQGGLEHELDIRKLPLQRGDHFGDVVFDVHPVVEKILHDHDTLAAICGKHADLVGQGRLPERKKGRQNHRIPDPVRDTPDHGRELQGNLRASAAVSKDNHSRFLHTSS
jgi:hypothetical protein